MHEMKPHIYGKRTLLDRVFEPPALLLIAVLFTVDDWRDRLRQWLPPTVM